MYCKTLNSVVTSSRFSSCHAGASQRLPRGLSGPSQSPVFLCVFRLGTTPKSFWSFRASLRPFLSTTVSSLYQTFSKRFGATPKLFLSLSKPCLRVFEPLPDCFRARCRKYLQKNHLLSRKFPQVMRMAGRERGKTVRGPFGPDRLPAQNLNFRLIQLS